MTSYEDAHRRIHAYHSGFPPVAPHPPTFALSPPPAYQPYSPNAVPFPQNVQTTLNPASQWAPSNDAASSIPREHQGFCNPSTYVGHYAHQGQAYESRSVPTSDTLRWIQYEPLKDRRNEISHPGHSRLTGREPIPHGHGLSQTDSYHHSHQATQSGIALQGYPYLPGAAQYVQRLEARNPAGPSNSLVPNFNNQGSPVLTAQRPAHSSNIQPKIMATGIDMSSVNNQMLVKQSVHTSGPLPGTQHAPLELSPSPEPVKKRKKVTSNPLPTPSKRRETEKRIGPVNYDGFSRQELSKMLAKATDIRSQKQRYYAVALGHHPGLYTDWPSAEREITGFKGAKHKKFKNYEEAVAWMQDNYKYVEPLPYSPRVKTTAQRSFDSGYRSSGIRHETFKSPSSLNPSSSVTPSSPLKPSSPQDHSLDLNRNFVRLSEGVVDDGPPLVPEQQHVVDLILQGHNVFYTGSAGCGKSTILKAFVKRLQQQGKNVKIVAPTNLAALNVGGQTTWNFAGWTPDSIKRRIEKLMDNSLGDKSWKKFDETDVLVIDEISMIENLMFERLNKILKHSRGDKYGGGAFGGLQLIVTGDFYQLAPVKPFSHCLCGWELEKDNEHNPQEYRCTNKNCREHTFYDIDKWAFRSRAWEECQFKHVNLTQIHRQNDFKLKSILNRIRTDGVILKNHANILLNHHSETEGAIEIYSRRVDVERVNNMNTDKIPSIARVYKCLDNFYWPEEHREDKTLEKNTYRMPDGSLSTLKDHRFDTRAQLKKDQRVVLQANLDPTAGLVNGAQGTIVEFQEFDEKALPRGPEKKGAEGDLRGDHAIYRQEQIKAFANANGRQPWPVVRFTNGVVRTIFADCTVNVLGNDEPWCLLSRTQIPLAAGYAITVHKSQGMTLDRVKVDLARAFEQSQIYVALSRARSLKGLTVTALPKSDLGGANAQVKEFMENVVMKKETGP